MVFNECGGKFMAVKATVSAMRERITDEIFMALGLKKTGWLRKTFGWAFYPPAQRFATLFSRADEATAREGLPGGGRSLVRDLRIDLSTRGLEQIPQSGPLVIVSNHPGAYDSAALSACIPRADLKIIVYETGFYHVLAHINQWLIHASEDPGKGMVALRQAIQHLRAGGALLQFGTGLIDPDPATLPGAEQALQIWSPSLEIMLRRAPETQVVLAIASGVLLGKFAHHPLTRLRREPMARRRLAEFLQIMQQLVAPGSVKARAQLSFATPVSVEQLAKEAEGRRLMPAVLERACRLLAEHRATWNLPESFPGENYEGY
jgi:hypothetical protein